MKPNFDIENKFQGNVIGVDEAGRGALVGPVIAAAVILTNDTDITDINDSKKISSKTREVLFDQITNNSIYAIGAASAHEIENINILQATLLAMRRAVEQINISYSTILIDGNHSPFDQENAHTIIKGDGKSLSIAAASIVAKVTRDRIMQELDTQYPRYDWKNNKGYGTKKHIAAIIQYGTISWHRKTFLKNIYHKKQLTLI